MSDYILETKNIEKWFGITRANNNINFKLKRGEIHGLIGENGSGKSTFTSMICGMQQPTSGEMFINGDPYAPKSVLDANKHKVSMVVQELGVLTDLTVAMNMVINRLEEFSNKGLLNMKKVNENAVKVLEGLGFGNIPVSWPAGRLSIENRKIVELAKAISIDPDIMVLDEISQALSIDSREHLYEVMNDFTSKGKSIIMISHDLEETVKICDSITILRDGQVVETLEREDFDLDHIKHAMIGRKMDGDYYRDDLYASYDEEVLLKVENLKTDVLQGVSFELHKGEILGVCGLSDAGIHDLGQALYGKIHVKEGKAQVNNNGNWTVLKKPQDLIRNHGAYLSKDRDSEGLMLKDSIANNLLIPSEDNLKKTLGFINPRDEKNFVNKAIDTFEIKCASPNISINSLSGGNKQKVNLGRWLMKDLNIIILDSPTRGVDVGVKAYIYSILKKAKEEGKAVLLISDELNEAIGMSDNLLVLKEGKVGGILSRNNGFAQEEIVEVMM